MKSIFKHHKIFIIFGVGVVGSLVLLGTARLVDAQPDHEAQMELKLDTVGGLTPSNDPSDPFPTPSCTETDGGKNIFEFGEVQKGGDLPLKDYCRDPSKSDQSDQDDRVDCCAGKKDVCVLGEYYCEDNEVSHEEVECLEFQICSHGKCSYCKLGLCPDDKDCGPNHVCKDCCCVEQPTEPECEVPCGSAMGCPDPEGQVCKEGCCIDVCPSKKPIGWCIAIDDNGKKKDLCPRSLECKNGCCSEVDTSSQ